MFRDVCGDNSVVERERIIILGNRDDGRGGQDQRKQKSDCRTGKFLKFHIELEQIDVRIDAKKYCIVTVELNA